ncbi:hypothetical protein HanIR_Chr14g0696281 [Helianthus annuus]|nr:hypothetical protein HanIR_Chr14g0696281 [Helianthus annuus]
MKTRSVTVSPPLGNFVPKFIQKEDSKGFFFLRRPKRIVYEALESVTTENNRGIRGERLI